MLIKISHEFDTTEEAFWKAFLDPEVMRQMYVDFMAFPEFSIDTREDDAKIRRTIRAIPKMEMPGALAKILGSSFRYTEESVFDKATKSYTWKTTPSVLADKLKNEGSMRVEVLGPNRIRRTAEIVLEAKVFGLGGTIESTFEKTLRDGWDKATEFFRKLPKT